MGLWADLFHRDRTPDAATLKAQGARVIDVRTRGEYRTGHIAGARNIDADSPTFASAVKGLSPRYTYVVYCQSGARAAGAIGAMQAAGLTVINGGSLSQMRSHGWELGA